MIVDMLADVALTEAEVEEVTVVDTFAVVVSETAVVDDGFLVEIPVDGAMGGAEEEVVVLKMDIVVNGCSVVMSVVVESTEVEAEETFMVVDTSLATVVVGISDSEETLANAVSEEKFVQSMVLSSYSKLHCCQIFSILKI